MAKKKYIHPVPLVFTKSIVNNKIPTNPQVGERYHVVGLSPINSWKIVTINPPNCTLLKGDKTTFEVKLNRLRCLSK